MIAELFDLGKTRWRRDEPRILLYVAAYHELSINSRLINTEVKYEARSLGGSTGE
jgi:hypothetical protein